MMTIGGGAHLLMVISSCIIGIILCLIVKSVNEKTQNIIIGTSSTICVLGIFFLHCTHYGTTLDFKNLLVQMFQVCNFNFILLPLCLIKRNELARQYLFFFSMPMALSTFVSYPSDIEQSMWYSIVCLTFWINHFLIVIIPFMMIATKRFKPRKEYIWKVLICIFIYFLVAFIANYVLNDFSIEGAHNHSYTMDAGGIMLLKPIYKLIPIPFIYLLPVLPVLSLLYYLIAISFKNYKINDCLDTNQKKGDIM